MLYGFYTIIMSISKYKKCWFKQFKLSESFVFIVVMISSNVLDLTYLQYMFTIYNYKIKMIMILRQLQNQFKRWFRKDKLYSNSI